MNRKRQKTFSIAVCVLFLFITFASLFYIAEEENHYCTGEDCPICANIHQTEQTLKNLATAMSAITIVNLMPVLFILLVMGWFLPVFHTSLVSQKVRLND